MGGISGAMATGGTPGSGGTGATSQGGSPGIALDQLAPALANALCDNLDACYASALRSVIHDENCRTLYTNVLTDQVIGAIAQSVARGNITYDPVLAEQCVTKVVMGTQQAIPQCFDTREVLENCKLMLGNLSSVSQPCNDNYECMRGMYCRMEPCPGTCMAFLQVGDVCSKTEECDPTAGFYCQKADGAPSGTCQPYVALNGSCQKQNCEPGALCIADRCRRTTDVLTQAVSLDCFSNGLLCEPGLSCEFTGLPFGNQATCVSGKQPLDPCRIALPEECPTGTYCSANILNNGGQCLAAPGENQKCASDFEQASGLAAQCQAGLVCISTICKPMRRVGEACEAHEQCYSGACFSALCVSPVCP
jgi:hypothetical protein